MERTQIRPAKVPNLRPAGKVILVLVAFLLLTSIVLATDGYEISRYVIGGGGGHGDAAPYTLDATIGQSVVGVSSNAPYQLCAGFWCGEGVGAQYEIYLPVLLKNYS